MRNKWQANEEFAAKCAETKYDILPHKKPKARLTTCAKKRKKTSQPIVVHSVTDSTTAILPLNIPTPEENENHSRKDTAKQNKHVNQQSPFNSPLMSLSSL